MKKKKIYMVCYGGGHVRIIAPLYKKLIHSYDVKILALTTAGEFLDSLSIPYLTFKDYSKLFECKVREYGEVLIKSLSSSSQVSHENSIYYLGCSFYELVKEYGEKEAYLIYKNKGRSAFLPIDTLSQILKLELPDIVLTTNAPRAERAALISAKSLGIKTICINDNLWISGGASEIVSKGLTDTICVLSDTVKSKLLNINPSVNVEVTGTPVFDKLKVKSKNIQSRSKDKKTILLADCDLPSTHPLYPGVIADPELGEKIRKQLDFLAVKRFWSVVFRPHPSQNYDYTEYKNVILSKPTDDVSDLLASTDIVVTAISTVGIEGLMSGAGLVSIEGTVYGKENSYFDYNLSSPVFSEFDLEDAIDEQLLRSKNINTSFYKGFAVDNIHHCINVMISS
ncbi:hypothetical protein [Vibrio parahaemolyticus]|uniref:hypothetical protein n=2 Tax=Vibrio parahaemolyticus TaxID=670 RepID=UPI001124C785|nr:hypothetical protein [Vibrio parahaemolyticus]